MPRLNQRWTGRWPGTMVALSVAVIVSAILTIWGRDIGWGAFVFKPLTTTLILLLAARAAPPVNSRYQRCIVTGLAFSLAGDILLMHPGDLFLAGLASFLGAHVCYLIAFTSDSRFAARPGPFLACAAIGIALMFLLWSGIPTALRLPVICYAACLLAGTAQASSRAWELRMPTAIAACAGTALFTASDALLAVNRFRFPLPFPAPLVLGPYFCGQWLIALSVLAYNLPGLRQARRE